MEVKYTNNYTILKDILKNEYQLILNLMFVNLTDIIQVLKNKMPLQGEVLEYLYQSMPSYYSNTHDKVCERYKYIDNIIRMLYKQHKMNNCKEFKRDVYIISNNFHIEDNEFDYYYFVALLIITLESSINEDAYNLYAQLDNNIQVDMDHYLQDFFSMLSKEEFQCLFYNHLEDVYETNLSIDNKVSVMNRNNYSFFLDSLNLDGALSNYLEVIENKRYPIIITDQNIFNIKEDKPILIQSNNIDAPIFDERVRFIASYYMQENKLKNWIPFFSYFGEYKDQVTIDDYNSFYNEYEIDYTIDKDKLEGSQNFYIYRTNDNNYIHYFIDKFSVYSNDIFIDTQEE